jgi:general secretion pathway protein M
MNNNLREIASKLLALSLLGFVTAAGYYILVEPFVGQLLSSREQIQEQRQLLARLSTTAQQQSADRDNRPASQAAYDALVLVGSSDAIRVATLQSLIGRIAVAEGVDVASTKAMPPREIEGLRLLGVELQLSATIEQLQRILFKLETGQPYLFVDGLRITSPPLIAGAEREAQTILSVRLALLGIAASGKG